MHFIFECLGYNELDHHAPVASELLKQGHGVTFLVESDLKILKDPKVEYLKQWDNFKVLHRDDFASRRSQAIFLFLSRCFFGRFSKLIPSNTLRLNWLTRSAGACGVFRAHNNLEFDCAISGWGDPSSLLMISAQTRKKVICALPHGYPCIKNFDFNPHIKAIYEKTGRGPDFSVRNQFATYVVATERNKTMLLAWKMSPSVVRVWGNARFSPAWVNVLLRILPSPTLKDNAENLRRVLILLPASTSGFHQQELQSLLEHLAQLPIHLTIKPHTRETGLSPLIPMKLAGRSNVSVAYEAHTSKLIELADTVINFATGTAIEALIAGKRLIFCQYLTENELSWEDCGGLQIANSEAELVNLVLDEQWNCDLEATELYLRQEIFAGGAIANPPLHYAEQLVQLVHDSKR